MSRRPVRLLVLDIDGTLLTSEKKVSPRTRAAIAAARAKGVRLVLATGRRYPSTLPVAEDLGGEVPLALHNGALVIEGGQVIRCLPLPRAVAVRILRLARDHGLDPVVHCGQKGEGLLLVEARARRAGLVSYYLERSAAHVVEVEDAAGLAEDPMQVMLGGTPEEMQAVRRELLSVVALEARIERTVYPRTGVEILDVLHPAVGKATAVAFLQERYGLLPEETLAIGDNWNDREMLEQAGRGFVMGGADLGLLELGLPVLPSSDEDGVAVALETHVL
ncbi:MAG TPA: HAD family hydrolase, partial [Vicinamibacteria bacterium]|nr:HAD family hydrolase [Vicinamibacteria bacterium]